MRVHAPVRASAEEEGSAVAAVMEPAVAAAAEPAVAAAAEPAVAAAVEPAAELGLGQVPVRGCPAGRLERACPRILRYRRSTASASHLACRELSPRYL